MQSCEVKADTLCVQGEGQLTLSSYIRILPVSRSGAWSLVLQCQQQNKKKRHPKSLFIGFLGVELFSHVQLVPTISVALNMKSANLGCVQFRSLLQCTSRTKFDLAHSDRRKPHQFSVSPAKTMGYALV